MLVSVWHRISGDTDLQSAASESRISHNNNSQRSLHKQSRRCLWSVRPFRLVNLYATLRRYNPKSYSLCRKLRVAGVRKSAAFDRVSVGRDADNKGCACLFVRRRGTGRVSIVSAGEWQPEAHLFFAQEQWRLLFGAHSCKKRQGLSEPAAVTRQWTGRSMDRPQGALA
jgi:hypothetical protein